MTDIQLFLGNCLEVMKGLPEGSVDAVITDPPAGISFMGKAWDSDKGGRDKWIAWLASVMAECLRVLKPGGHAFVWALPRTSHWTAMALEDAGFEIRDCVYHLFGSGFPKSLDVSKQLDKMAGAEREVVGFAKILSHVERGDSNIEEQIDLSKNRVFSTSLANTITAPATDDARKWDGWGTALKPAAECWWLARKPLISTVAANVLAYGTGALNIDKCRVETTPRTTHANGNKRTRNNGQTMHEGFPVGEYPAASARWPANVIHDGSDEVVGLFPVTTSGAREPGGVRPMGAAMNRMPGERTGCFPGSTGSAARFFYCAKASQSERGNGNDHATVKPLTLMRYLVRLITPPGGTVLDPFMGSGTTGIAASREGFRFIGIEIEEHSLEIAKRRIDAAQTQLSLPLETG